MFWIHGGGFSIGSGASPWYDGAKLARKQDVVVVTINHRLNVLGYCHLGAFDPRFADSSNCATLDIALALQWVKANVQRFGGDPNRVMVHGQSGGGRKTSLVLATTACQGLYHRAVIQSGAQLRVDSLTTAEAKAKRLLDLLQISTADAAKLQQVPIETLQTAQAQILGPAQWMPAAGSPSLPKHPFDRAAPEMSQRLPVMIGTCRTEQAGFLAGDEAMDTLDDAGLKSRLDRLQAGQGQRIFTAYKALHPEKSDPELFYMAATDRSYFLDATIAAGLRADAGEGATYAYVFNRQTPVAGGRFFAPHAEEIPFVFDTLKLAAVIAGPDTPEAQRLADQVSALWASFARDGVPSAPGVPRWPRYDSLRRPTLMIDDLSVVADDPRAEERRLMASYGSQQEANGRG